MSEPPAAADAQATPDDEASRAPAAPPSDAGSETGIEILWRKVMTAWDDDKAHAALLELALRTEQLPEIAGRYRALKDDPDKGAHVQKRLDAIVIAATQLMMSMKTPPPSGVPAPLTIAAAGIFLFTLGVLAYYVLGRM